ncbi:2,4-dihydroxyhept-2-ene-1,7-dioic acid aldolase [Acrocarpospora corrugata]|uniref:2,4-dihydroxyhept-2-ene-1,7-dioic acid aldolase n=1 Tax=Acrocarpospora corrugata TaxID=35763 RepID=A0A5M3W9M0_9ACTN|nr:aldolase/citrate lyase family protein [Acrocarpospora corrugata]GES05757.1 2,4-dihydroxyhept-2-ene-1,7-dioic acid aldolase [Acrocarpospora corrugata]
MSNNPLITRWQAGQVTYGVWCTMPGSVPAEMIARQGVDYCCVDYQHGLIEHSTGVPMMQAIEAGGSVPIARVNWNETNRIMQVLDAGARGVVVPMVNNAEEAARAVSGFRFPPHGGRSYGPVRAREVLGTTNPEELADQACIIMIETVDGIRNVREIAAVPGVDALYIGPSDLALSLGLLPNHTPPDPRFVEVIDEIRAACLDHGIAAGIQCANGEDAAKYTEQGFTMITIASDAPLLASAVRANLATAKGGPAGGARPTGNY